MPMILVADDSEVDRLLIIKALQKEPLDWLVETVSSAEEAVKMMREMAFDIVITDVLMSGMSGLELLNHVHSQPHRVPVIVVSGQDDQSAAVDALRQGAASFVRKNELVNRLGDTVKQVLEAARAKQSYHDLIECAEEMRYHFRLANDPVLIYPLISLLQEMSHAMGLLTDDARTRFGIAIEEAVINAMCHGNLELSEDDMAEVRGQLHSGCAMNAIQKRRQMEPYCDRTTHVSIGMSRDGVKVIIRDDGRGFQPSKIDYSKGQRGIMLIQNLVDKATFNDTGNEITLIKRRDREATPHAPHRHGTRSAVKG